MRDILESQGRVGRPPILQELNLDVSTEELLSADRGSTYSDLYLMSGNGTVVWLTPHVAVARVVVNDARVLQLWRNSDERCLYSFNVDGKCIDALALSPEHILEICDVVLRLLAASVAHSVILHKWSVRDVALINATSLAYLMERCQSLKLLSLHDLEMDDNHCRVLGAYSRPDLELELNNCKLTNAGTSALVEVLGRNQGPTKLDCCEIDNSVLADGLRGNSRLKNFEPSISSNLDVAHREVLAIAGALKENKGLVYLDLEHYFRMSDETWGAICDSLKAHPTLQVLGLQQSTDRFAEPRLAPAVLTSRIQALVDMLKVNTSIQHHTSALPLL
jgi:hypothetical protein